MSHANEPNTQNRPASRLERELLTDRRSTADDFPDPFGEHNIEWWVWDGERLVPATDGDMREIEEYERSRAALRQLSEWNRDERTRLRRLRGMLTDITWALRGRGSERGSESPGVEPTRQQSPISDTHGETP